MAITTSNNVVPHALLGDQTGVVTVGLQNGGYVAVWTDNFTGGQKDVKFQLYNGNGEAVGSVVTANSTTAGDQVALDVEATADGRFTILWGTGSTLTARSFDGATGTAATAEANLATLNSQAVSGAQLIATGSNTLKVMFTSNNTGATNTLLEQSTFNSNTGAFGAKTTVNSTLAVGQSIIDIDPGNGSDQLALLTAGATSTLVSAANGTVLVLPSNVGALTKLQENAFLTFGELTNGQVSQNIITGFNADISTFSTSAATGLLGVASPNTSQDVHARTMVDLGGGRIMLFWVAETGTGSNGAQDGVYATVFNTTTLSFVESVTLITFINSFQSDLSGVTLDAKRMADGRVSVMVGQPAPLFANFNGRDVQSMIVDARVSGITVSGTAQADVFKGTASTDVFQVINIGDRVDGGGGGNDTVIFDNTGGRRVDLLDANRFLGEASGISGTGINNLIGAEGNDEFYGSSLNNSLSANGGDDKLFGRDGNDTLDGGNGNDLLSGGSGLDDINGGLGNDVINGGAGDDDLNGAGDNDTISGGDGNDIIFGGDGIDQLYGNAGDDSIDAGAGADFVAGGLGNDTLNGGADNDAISGGDGDDIIDGGAGNDTISGGRGLNVIDGGANNDTVTYASAVFAPGFSGVYADLDPKADPFGNMEGFEVDDDIIVNVENLIGSAGNDYLAGSSVANSLKGGGGDDILTGRAGNDTLTGGAGADQFLFEATNGGNDTIRDFTVAVDKILLVSSSFGNISAETIVASFVANAAATPAANVNPQLIFDTGGGGAGRILFDADGNGAGAAVVIATLSFTTAGGLATFSAADFAFI